MKKVRIADIAKHAGVSNATVSRALNQKNLVNQETYDKIIDAMRELGYTQPSFDVFATEGTSRSLLIADLPSIENPFYLEILRGVESVAKRYEYHIIIHTSGLKSLVSLSKEIGVAGVITFNTYSSAQLDRLCSVTSVMQCCEFCNNYPLPYVSIDDYRATINALNYLYSLGRRKFSIINQSGKYKYATERFHAFSDFMKSHDLELDDDKCIQLPEVNYQIAVFAISSMLSKEDRPDAIFAVSDVYALAAINVAHKLGISVPHELSIVGFDNTPLSQMSNPSITTVNQPKFQLGYMACEFLIEKIHNPAIKNKQFILDTELIIREST